MDDAPFSQPRNASPEYYAPEADASTRMTDEDFILLKPTPYVSTQTEDDFEMLAQIQPRRNISDTSKTVFSGFHEYSKAVETEVEDVLSSMEAWADFDMASGSRYHVETSEFYMQPAFPENILEYSRQSTQHDNNKTVSTQGKHTVNYPAVYMECRTLNKDVWDIDEPLRNKNVNSFRPRGPRNVDAESCLPPAFLENIAYHSNQYTPHESNANASIQGTHTVEYPAVSQQESQSSHQSTWGESNKYASSQDICNEEIRKKGRNRDFILETSTAKNCRTSENSRLADIHHDILNVEESQSYNQGMQSKFVKEISLTCKQNIASNYSFLTSSQNDNGPGKISDSGASVRESIKTKNDIPEVPGPSGVRCSEDSYNFIIEKLQLNYPSDMQSVVTRDDKQFTCRVCKTKISTHTDGSSKTKLYYCCICEYNSCEKAYLLVHSYKHCSKNFCNLCSKEYTDGDSHYSEQTCTVCEKTFHCRSQLDEHWMDHEDYFLKHCWVCYKSFDCHFREEEGKILFVCCDCEFVDDNISHLKRHNRIHRRKILCKICEEDYNITEKDSHKSEFKCIACKKKFQCKALLEDHFIVHTEYFLTYCRVCNRKLKEHQTENKKKLFFSCCICLKVFNLKSLLQSHLNFHTGLKLFKCDLCGKRFSQKSSLGKHSRTCSAVPYKCEICGARFPSNNFLDSHCSVKHRQAR